MLKTGKLKGRFLEEMRGVFKELPTELLHEGQVLPVKNKTGCSKARVGYIIDYKPGSLVPLTCSLPMDRVAGTLFIKPQEILQYELLKDEGGLTALETQGLSVPKLECCLFSPQDLFGEIFEQGGEEGILKVRYSPCVPKPPNQGPVGVPRIK